MGFYRSYRWDETEDQFFEELLNQRAAEAEQRDASQKIRQHYASASDHSYYRGLNWCKSKEALQNAETRNETANTEMEDEENKYRLDTELDTITKDSSNQATVRDREFIRNNTKSTKNTSYNSERKLSETNQQISTRVGFPSRTEEKSEPNQKDITGIRPTQKVRDQITNNERLIVDTPDSEFRIIIVGDVHGYWDKSSESAVARLNPDLLLFVGDYGNNRETKVFEIAEFCAQFENEHKGMACATLGNGEAKSYAASPTRRNERFVAEQLKALHRFNASERPRSYCGISVVGGRPFSWGGSGDGW